VSLQSPVTGPQHDTLDPLETGDWRLEADSPLKFNRSREI
jgi:hypothetical protein